MRRKQKASTFPAAAKKHPPHLLAFRSFAEIESMGRKMFSCIGSAKHAPNVWTDLFGLYLDALGESPKWTRRLSKVGKFILKGGKHKAKAQKEAAEDLVNLTLSGVQFVSMLYETNPNLCRDVARTLGRWPVSADMTERSWQRKVENVVADLKLGSAVGGFLLSTRTANENPIRRYATTIYDTLFQTRWRFKEADQRDYGRQGCPLWAEKTLALPPFTRAQVRAWAVLGKEMLLEQRPNFIEDEALKEQKFKWTKRAENRSKSGKPTLRAIQNEAFDDFSKELRKLAPAENIYRGEW